MEYSNDSVLSLYKGSSLIIAAQFSINSFVSVAIASSVIWSVVTNTFTSGLLSSNKLESWSTQMFVHGWIVSSISGAGGDSFSCWSVSSSEILGSMHLFSVFLSVPHTNPSQHTGAALLQLVPHEVAKVSWIAQTGRTLTIPFIWYKFILSFKQIFMGIENVLPSSTILFSSNESS